MKLSFNSKGPLNKKEKKAYTKLTKWQLTYENDNIIKCPTGGQPLYLMKIRKARKESSIVKSPLKKKRAREISTARLLIAGSKSGATQQASELKQLPKDTRKNVCLKAGIEQDAELTAKKQLAMKAKMRLTWTQCRAFKRFAKSVGIKYESERREREERSKTYHAITATKMTVWVKNDKAPDSINVMITQEASVVYVSDLPEFVMNLLDEYDNAGKLCWDGFPQEEVWIKMGADFGGESFKVCLQVVNLDAPNAKENTVVIGCFETKDLYPNLAKATEIFQSGIDALNQMTWREKRLRLFIFGDYAFLCNLYGLSGSAGIHFCLWCHINRNDMQRPLSDRGKAQKRTHKTIVEDNKRFQREGRGNKQQASHYNNAIHAPLWNVRVSHVCPPYLHLLLGIVKKHHDMLEEDCHIIDKAIAVEMAEQEIDPPANTLFDKHVKKLRQVRRLTEEQKKKVRELEFERKDRTLEAHQRKEVKDELKKAIQQLDSKITQCLAEATLDSLSGPVTANLEKVLYEHNIKIQAYHSRSMTGNHCSAYVREKVFNAIAEAVVTKTKALTSNQIIITDAETIEYKYKLINSKFSKIHSLIGHGNPIPKESLPEIQEAISSYLTEFRTHFPGRITPKLHILEDHIEEWIKRWGFGMARHGEQGGESAHREFNRLTSNMSNFRGLRRLVAVMREHHMSIHPTISRHIIHPKRRRLQQK